MIKIFTAFAFLLAGYPAQGAEMKTKVFGYVEGFVEKVSPSPTRTGGSATAEGTVSRTQNAHEFNTPAIHAMVKSSIGKHSAFLNLAAPDGGNMLARNAWVEAALIPDYLNIRIGKLYRRFGLYNERLDAVPTYIGIEPPELFDSDHLLLTRTTNLMIHGTIAGFSWSLMTGNDERFSDQIPLGGDLRYTLSAGSWNILLGTSFYASGKAAPSVSVGSGSPNGGVVKLDDRRLFQCLRSIW